VSSPRLRSLVPPEGYTHMYAYRYIRVYVRDVHTCGVYIHACVRASYSHIHIYTYIPHTCMHVYIHIYYNMHTHIHIPYTHMLHTRIYMTGWRRIIGFVKFAKCTGHFPPIRALQLQAHLEKMTYLITNPIILRHPVAHLHHPSSSGALYLIKQ
jgi:hypothetical protein